MEPAALWIIENKQVQLLVDKRVQSIWQILADIGFYF